MEKEKEIYPSDEELIKRAKARDRSAFDALYNRYKRAILNYVFRLIGNREEAEEITQETFIKAYTHLATYRPTGKVSSWFYAIAGNLAKNVLRHRTYEKTVSLEKKISIGDEEVEFIQMLASKGPRPNEVARRHEIESKIQTAIDLLPAKYKMAVVLCEIQGLSYEEAAQIMRCDVRTVGSRLSRARAMLAKTLRQAEL